MTDLNVTLFYKAHFQVAAKDPDSDLLWDLILKIRYWMCGKWRRNNEEIPWNTSQWSNWKNGCTFRSVNGVVTLISAYHKEESGRINWACRLVESPDGEKGFAPREWITEIGFRQPSDEAADITMVVVYRDRPGFIGLCSPLPDATAPCPRLIRAYLEDQKLLCTMGRTPLTLHPTPVTQESWQEFRSLVLDQDRTVPVVYLSPKRLQPEGEETELLLKPDQLASVLGPNALVYYGTSLEVSRLMSSDPYKEILGCYNGGIRIYASTLRKDQPGEELRHRFLTGVFVQDHGSEAMMELLRRALAQDFSGYESSFRVENCRTLIYRAKLERDIARHREEAEQEILEDAVALEEKLAQEHEKLDEERLEWEIERELLKSELEEARSALHQEQARANYFQDDAIKARQLERSMEEVRQIKEYPENPEQIAAFFLSHFKDRLVFTKRGLSSLKDCETAAGTLWAALYDMATVLYDLYHSEDYMEVDREFNRRSRFRLSSNAGMMTRDDKQLMKEYMDEYEGRTINTEAHIKSSSSKGTDKNFLRIYFCFDSSTEKLVISSCGKHRKNYSTRKIH